MNDRSLSNSWCARVKAKLDRLNKRVVRRVSYTSIFVVVLALVAASYTSADSTARVSLPGVSTDDTLSVNKQQGQKVAEVNQANAVASSVSSNTGGELAGGTNTATPTTTNDDVKSANVASAVAEAVNLSSSSSVSSGAESVNISAELAQADATSVNKSQILESTNDSKTLIPYTIQEGDTITAIAKTYDVTDQTVRWANGLKDDNVAVGSTINVPTIDGVVYTVSNGDTLEGLAEKYKSNVEAIININDLSGDKPAAGTILLLPDGVLPETDRPEYVAPTPTNLPARSSGSGTRGLSSILRPPLAGGNRYAYGYCTWYAYNRRAQLGMKLLAVTWGNANTWDTGAAASGYLVDHAPSVGAVFQTNSGYYGHVGIVEAVYSDGSIRISEMNYSGWNRITEGYLTPANYRGYSFIHQLIR